MWRVRCELPTVLAVELVECGAKLFGFIGGDGQLVCACDVDAVHACLVGNRCGVSAGGRQCQSQSGKTKRGMAKWTALYVGKTQDLIERRGGQRRQFFRMRPIQMWQVKGKHGVVSSMCYLKTGHLKADKAVGNKCGRLKWERQGKRGCGVMGISMAVKWR